MDQTLVVEDMPTCERVGSIYLYRNGGRNRLLVGTPTTTAEQWAEVLSSLGFDGVPHHRNGSILAFWVAHTHPPFTREGELHTEMLREVIVNLVEGRFTATWLPPLSL